MLVELTRSGGHLAGKACGGRVAQDRSREQASVDDRSAEHAAVSFFDQPVRVTRFRLVHAVWRRQRMEMLPGGGPGVAAAGLCVPGRDEGSPRCGSRSTPGWSWTQPRRRCRSSQRHGREAKRPGLAVPQRGAGNSAGSGDPGPDRPDGGRGDGIRAFPPGSAITAAVRCRPTPSG